MPENGIPFLPGRARYNILGVNPSWVFHTMAGGASMLGDAPEIAPDTPDDIDPEVVAGRSEFKNLTKGGLFTLLGNYHQPIVISQIDHTSVTKVELVRKDPGGGPPVFVRDITASLATLPVKVSAGEYLKCTGGTGASAGFMVHIDKGAEKAF